MLKIKIAYDLDVPVSLIDKAIRGAYSKVKRIRIPKKKGGFREIYQPSRNLKVIQYWLINNIFSHLVVHKSASAYRKKYSIKDNVSQHSKNRYFLKLDIENFFPSITFLDFLPIITTLHESNNTGWALDAESKEIIKRSCFDGRLRLPIGYPTSPIISNAVMFEIDSKLSTELNSNVEKYGNTTYTRYADDFIFSTDKKGASNEIKTFVEALLLKTKSPRLNINTTKTRFSSSSGGSAFVTGLRICHDGHITIHRKHKDHVRLMLLLFKKEKLKPEENISLKGHINYIRYIDPIFYNKLQRKYFKELSDLLKP